MSYQLSKVLVGHSQDVKSVKVLPNQLEVLSGSRDSNLLLHHLTTSTATSFKISEKFVNSVTYLPPKPSNEPSTSSPSIVGGSSDHIIKLISPTKPTSQKGLELIGHTDNVCCLEGLNDGRLLSSSWDKTVKVWLDWDVIATLKGHEQAVWAVKYLKGNNCIVTGSADKTIKLWDGNSYKLIKTINAHSDCVRGIDEVPGVGFVSCGNDAVVKVWSYDGELIQELYGHTSFIYSVATVQFKDESFGYVTGGEDRSVRIWKDGSCYQVISMPCISIWCVDTFENGDIVAGGNDGMLRIFTTSKERYGDNELREQFTSQVASLELNSTQTSTLDPKQIKTPDSLLVPGTKEGQTKFIRSQPSLPVEAYQWSNGEWLKIGEVVDTVDNNNNNNKKQLLNGKEFDQVFDINLEDGKPNLKLGLNIEDNPYNVAMEFLQKNMLPLEYVDQIVEFINKNSNLPPPQPNTQFVDPYTGSSRYVAGGNTVATNQSSQSYNQKVNKTCLFPLKEIIKFDQLNLSGIIKKINEFNSQVDESLKLNSNDLNTLNQSTPNNLNSNLIIQTLTNWPEQFKFPFMDLLRYLTLNSTISTKIILDIINPIINNINVIDKSKDTLLMLTYRTISNLLTTNQTPHAPIILDLIHQSIQHLPNLSINTQSGLLACLVNLSINLVINNNNQIDEDLLFQSILTTSQALINTNQDEPIYRGLVALGNFITIKFDKDWKQVIQFDEILVKLNSGSDRVRKLKSEIENMV